MSQVIVRRGALTRPGTITVKEQCHAKNKNGQRCTRITKKSNLCWQHLERNEHVKIKESTLGAKAGLGLFTTTPRVKGEDITEYTGFVLVNPPQGWKSHYALQIKKNPITVIDAKMSNTAPGRYANSGGKLNNSQFVYDRRNAIAHIRAVKKIPVGNEIFVPYGRGFSKF
jgi:hypothetical protein